MKRRILAIMLDTETDGFGGEALCIQALPIHPKVSSDVLLYVKNDANHLAMSEEQTIVQQMFDHLVCIVEEYSEHISSVRLYIHNAAFDLPRIIKGLPEVQVKHITSGSSHISSTLIYNGVTFLVYDTLRMLPASLRSLAQSLAPHCLKGEIDHVEGFDVDNEQHLDYARQDVRTLRAILESYARILEKDFTDIKMTVAAESFHILSQSLTDNEGIKKKLFAANYETNEYFKNHAYSGGRVFIRDSFPLCTPVDHVSFDITSSYPYQMQVQHLPIGVEPKVAKVRLPAGAGRYFVKIKVSDYVSDFPILPYRTVDEEGLKTSTVYPIGSFTTILADLEYDYFLKNQGGSSHVVIEYLYWHDYECHNYMKAYVDKWASMKTEGDRLNSVEKGSGDAMRTIAKLMLNSPYGKFAQTYDQDPAKHYIYRDGERYDLAEETLKELHDEEAARSEKKRDHRSVFVAAFITAGARIKLMEVIDFYGAENVSYGDTDSAKVLKSAVDKLGYPTCIQQDKYENGKKIFEPAVLGMWKDEGVAYGMMLVAPKVYIYKDKTGKIELKSKGFPTNNISILHIGDKTYPSPSIRCEADVKKWEKKCLEYIYAGLTEHQPISAQYGLSPVAIKTFVKKGTYAKSLPKTLYDFNSTHSYDYDDQNVCYRVKQVNDQNVSESFKYWTKRYKAKRKHG